MSHDPPNPSHTPGTTRGEEYMSRHGREPGREEKDKNGYRAARDSTSIDPKTHGPIDPRMPEMPPA